MILCSAYSSTEPKIRHPSQRMYLRNAKESTFFIVAGYIKHMPVPTRAPRLRLAKNLGFRRVCRVWYVLMQNAPGLEIQKASPVTSVLKSLFGSFTVNLRVPSILRKSVCRLKVLSYHVKLRRHDNLFHGAGCLSFLL